jgi:signal transduction histidine kinase/ActR/RegA family two-component response regulator
MRGLRIGLWLKFIVLISLLILITSVTLSQFFLDHLETEEAQDLRNLGLTIARNLAYNAELGVLARNREMLVTLCQGPLRQDEVAYLRVYGRDGEELARADAFEGLALRRPGGEQVGSGTLPWEWDQLVPMRLEAAQRPPFDGLELRVPVITVRATGRGEEVEFLLEPEAEPAGREVIGSVVVGLSLEQTQAEGARLRRDFSLLTGLVVLFGIGMTVLIVRVVTTPIQRMVLATGRIAEGKLDEKVDASSQDEIGDLGRAFNQMTENLRTSRQALESYSADLEEKVRQRTAELETAQSQLVQAEKMSAMGELVSGVAHELNNPLAGVIGYSQLLLGAEGVEEKTRRGLERINREATRCKRIVQNLQVFARKHKPQKQYVGINGILESTLDLRAYQMQVDNVKVETDLLSDLPKTMADFHQLQQVFVNLLVNAHHAIKQAGRPGRVLVQTRHERESIVVRVRDNGCGIPPENLKRIFDPFFTTKEVGQGTGLGLSICYGIVQEHRGKIYATSRPGEETTFVVELPVLAPPQGYAGEAPPAVEPAPEEARRAPRRSNILVIDDETSIVDVLHQALQLDGHRVDTAGNGKSALRKIRSETYDVIISDLKMPGMSGHELYESVRQMSPDLARRIIFSTGDVASHETREFLERCGNLYLQKPFDLHAIRSVVAQMLSNLPN